MTDSLSNIEIEPLTDDALEDTAGGSFSAHETCCSMVMCSTGELDPEYD